jgi:hypothetical protein
MNLLEEYLVTRIFSTGAALCFPGIIYAACGSSQLGQMNFKWQHTSDSIISAASAKPVTIPAISKDLQAVQFKSFRDLSFCNVLKMSRFNSVQNVKCLSNPIHSSSKLGTSAPAKLSTIKVFRTHIPVVSTFNLVCSFSSLNSAVQRSN